MNGCCEKAKAQIKNVNKTVCARAIEDVTKLTEIQPLEITGHGHTCDGISGCRLETNNLQSCWKLIELHNEYTREAFCTEPHDGKYQHKC